MVDVFSGGGGGDDRKRALALVAMCVGAMVSARAIDDAALGDELRDAARSYVKTTMGWSE
jgi:hypothetical protein